MKYADKHTLLVTDSGSHAVVKALPSCEVIMLDIIARTWRWPQYRQGATRAAEGSYVPEIARSCGPNPLVSIVIPAYNASAFIARTINSVIAQTYQNLEIVVIDDGSRDRTVDIVQAIAQKDTRIQLFQQPNAGVAAARNLGIEKATGTFIAPIDADDLWAPEAVEKLVAQFQKEGADTGVIYTWSVDIDEQNRATGGFHAATITGNVYKTLICHNFLGNASSTMIRKACVEKAGGYSTQLKQCQAQGCEDWDFYLRLAEHSKFGVVPEFLVGYRQISLSMSKDFEQMARSQQLMLQTVQQNNPKIPKHLYGLSRSSFYLYLAQQCDKYSHPRATLSWLWRSTQAEPITPLCRLGFYVLLFKNLAKQLSKKSRSGSQEQVEMSVRSPLIPLLEANLPCPMSIEQPKIHRVEIWLKVFASTLLHRSLLIG